MEKDSNQKENLTLEQQNTLLQMNLLARDQTQTNLSLLLNSENIINELENVKIAINRLAEKK